MNEIHLRPAAPEDVPAMAALIASLPEWFTPQAVAQVRAEAADQRGFVATDNIGAVVGFILWDEEANQIEIKWTAVAPDRHRQGIGTALMARFLERAREAGAHRVRVATLAATVDYEPYARTRAFYETCGFRFESMHPTEKDRADYVLELGHRKEGHMSEVTVRRAAERDADAIVRLWREMQDLHAEIEPVVWTTVADADALFRSHLADLLGDPDHAVFVAEAMAWFREQGLTIARAGWAIGNPASGPFWQAQGFRPYQVTGVRPVDMDPIADKPAKHQADYSEIAEVYDAARGLGKPHVEWWLNRLAQAGRLG